MARLEAYFLYCMTLGSTIKYEAVKVRAKMCLKVGFLGRAFKIMIRGRLVTVILVCNK